ncbi:MAG: hypothetical protein EOM80_16850 [Erysipelotrichia bacterium]|nr:hypothetical protein [Erysipelotrichia bacterium]
MVRSSDRRKVLKFLNARYITLRCKFVEYSHGNAYTVYKQNRGRSLCDSDIIEHFKGSKCIGVHFPKNISNLIGFDIDSLDIELVKRLYDALFRYGVAQNNMLVSFSGGKGYHIDVFLNRMVEKTAVRDFYAALLKEIDATPQQVDLYGANGKGYKIPLGFHYKTGAFCYLCDENGSQIPDNQIVSFLQEIEPLDPKVLADAVDIHFADIDDAAVIVGGEELISDINMLDTYGSTNAGAIERMQNLLKDGVHEKGNRHFIVTHVAAYLKDEKKMCLGDAIDFITGWVKTTWGGDALSDREFPRDIEKMCRYAYRVDFKFHVRAKPIHISAPDIREIFSIETGNRLQNEALRRLYYCFLVHSRAYGDAVGVFYMSYSQIAAMGGTKDSGLLVRQINRLVELSKVNIVSRNSRNTNAGQKGQKFNRPNEYSLPQFQCLATESGVRFTVCQKSDKCKDCCLIALCKLVPDSERRKMVKGKRFKDLPTCEINSKAA